MSDVFEQLQALSEPIRVRLLRLLEGLHKGGAKVMQTEAEARIVEVDQGNRTTIHQHVLAQEIGVDQADLARQPFPQRVAGTEQGDALVGGSVCVLYMDVCVFYMVVCVLCIEVCVLCMGVCVCKW